MEEIKNFLFVFQRRFDLSVIEKPIFEIKCNFNI